MVIINYRDEHILYIKKYHLCGLASALMMIYWLNHPWDQENPMSYKCWFSNHDFVSAIHKTTNKHSTKQLTVVSLLSICHSTRIYINLNRIRWQIYAPPCLKILPFLDFVLVLALKMRSRPCLLRMPRWRCTELV